MIAYRKITRIKVLAGLLIFFSAQFVYSQNPEYQMLNQMFKDQVLRTLTFDAEKFKEIPPVLQEELKEVSGAMSSGEANCLFVGAAYKIKDQAVAASWVGNQLKRKVYHVRLQHAVSLYIGETEKNLEKLFDLAEKGKWILFFDEADAIFGQRTTGEVNSTNKYANLETSYFLKQIRDHHVPVFMRVNRAYPELKSTFQYQIIFD
ncbi:MAG: AAA family ATPase [Bacteroidia bacterium]